MKEVWHKLKEWWSPLSLREKQATVLGCVFVIFFIGYQWIWTPFNSRVLALRTRIQADQKTLVWMQAAQQDMQKLASQAENPTTTLTPVIFLTIAQKQIAQAGLDSYLTQLKQSSHDAIDMRFQKIQFDKLMQLLLVLMKENKISISQMSVTALNTQGIVNADILVKL